MDDLDDEKLLGSNCSTKGAAECASVSRVWLRPEIAWQTLREAATAYHRRIGVCPFCKGRGPLHLPAEQLTMGLSHGS